MTTRPMKFKRGGSFSTTFTIPSEYNDGHFANWLPLAQVRCASNALPNGLVAVLDCAWEDKVLARKMGVMIKNTDKWPTGLIHVDVLLTSPSGENFRTDPLVLDCVPGVTEVTP